VVFIFSPEAGLLTSVSHSVEPGCQRKCRSSVCTNILEFMFASFLKENSELNEVFNNVFS